MKIKFVISVFLVHSLSLFSQMKWVDSLSGFNDLDLGEHFSFKKNDQKGTILFDKVKREYIKRKYDLFPQTNPLVFKVDSTAGCGNLDFENGNTSGWAITGDFQLTSGNAIDSFGCFPVVCPGGNYSLKLNNDNISGTKTAFTSSASKTIAITPSNSLIKINLAGCFLDFPHPSSSAAFFLVKFYDALNNIIPTQSLVASYFIPPGAVNVPPGVIYYTSPLAGKSIISQTYAVTYVPWQSQLYNLSPYVGQSIRVKLTAEWCMYNVDWAYMYFDLCCNSGCPNPPGQICPQNYCSSLPSSLCGPPNMSSYAWLGPSGPVTTNSCATISTAGIYSLTCYSPLNPTLALTYQYTVVATPTVAFSLSNNFCNTTSSVSLSASPPGGVFSGPGVTGNNFDPSLLGTGNYTITYTYTNPVTTCSVISSQTTAVSACTGFDEFGKIGNDFNVFPNPFNNLITIANKNNNIVTTFVLCDIVGKEIIRKKMEDKTNYILTDYLQKGIYLYSMYNENQMIKNGKMIKE